MRMRLQSKLLDNEEHEDLNLPVTLSYTCYFIILGRKHVKEKKGWLWGLGMAATTTG